MWEIALKKILHVKTKNPDVEDIYLSLSENLSD